MAMGLSRLCGTLVAVSCGLSFLAMLLHAAAFGSRSWVVSKENSPFLSIGFHLVCFDDCRDPYCVASGPGDAVWTGCSKLYKSWDLQELWDWILTDWFKYCRTLAIVNIPLTLLIFILLAVCTSIAFVGRYTTDTEAKVVRKAKALQVMLFIAASIILTSSILNMIIMITFYSQGFERSWMPMPEKNGYGMSFWLCFTSTVLLVFAFLCIITATISKTMWLYGDKDPRYSEDMMYPAPSTTTTPPGALGQAMAKVSRSREPSTGTASTVSGAPPLALAHALRALDNKTV